MVARFLFYSIFAVYPLGLIVYFPIASQGKIPFLDIITCLFIISTLFVRNPVKKIFLKKQILIFLFVSLLAIAINMILKNHYSISDLFYFIRISFYFLFYIRIFFVFNKSNAFRINWILLISGFVFSAFGLLQYLLYPDLRNLMYLGWDPHYFRLFSTVFDPNFAGIIIVLTFFQLIFIMWLDKKSVYRFLYPLLIIILLVAIYLTRSRSAYLSFISGMIVLIFFKKYINKMLIGVTAIVILLSSFIPKPAFNVLDTFRVSSSISRVNNWLIALKLGFANILTGVGYSEASFSDSSLLYIFGATGILSLAALFNVLFKIFRFSLKKDKELFVITVVVIVSSFFNNTLFYPFVAVWFFAFLASSVIRYSS
ncbi:hypothetical protein HYT02_01685 [Candidatus Gottesmanbacteria bacterium]|nr:hypothetical protein [Candidatus Gottesmanbacteria bacterium]